MTPEGDTFSITLDLAPGAYQYKFIVDSVWQNDNGKKLTFGVANSTIFLAKPTTDDGHGNLNNIVHL